MGCKGVRKITGNGEEKMINHGLHRFKKQITQIKARRQKSV